MDLEANEQSLRRLIRYVVIVGVIGTGLAWGLFLAREALSLIYLSLMLALGFSPTVRWIERHPWLKRRKRRPPRWLAILVFYVGVLLVIALLLDIIIEPLVTQTQELAKQLPDYVARAQKWLVSRGIMVRALKLPELLAGGPAPAAAVTNIVGVVTNVANFVLTAISVLLLSYFFLVEGESLFKGLLRWAPPEKRPMFTKLAAEATTKVGAWMSGQFILCVLIGATAALGFWLLDLPYFYVLALICGIGEAIPIIGPLIAAVPCILVAMTVSGNTAAMVAMYLFVQQQVENSIIVPRLMEKQTGISAVVVMVALLIGGATMGVIGALLAVPTAAILQIAIQAYLDEREAQRDAQ
jgi:predicted PurR-regulated permease PerM